MIRKIVSINESKCNGCGLCVNACHEGAIKMIDGKARLISDKYCDGLGDCLPACPADAITIIEREADNYDEDAVAALQSRKGKLKEEKLPCGCPGTMARKIERPQNKVNNAAESCEVSSQENNISELTHWPVQLKLVNPAADYFNDANLLIAADCTAFAYGNFHKDFIKNHTTVIGCPKLDDIAFYEEKLTQILKDNEIKSITVVRMEVPCCTGIVNAVKHAMLKAEKIVPYKEIIVSINGSLR